MANTYNLEIVGFQTKITDGELENVVVEIHYKHSVVAEDGETWKAISTCLVIDAPDPDNFTEFNELTPEIVKSWIGEDRIESDKAILDEQLLEAQTPSYELKETPW
jgi:hypothetical protein